MGDGLQPATKSQVRGYKSQVTGLRLGELFGSEGLYPHSQVFLLNRGF
jgi:hypothetical protein